MIKHLYTYSGNGTDPYRNLALEQYLTEHVADDACILYLWQNQNTVVIGRNQNAWQECRTGLLEQEGGTLARRLSGGGAVFHDMGNLNFTFSVSTENYDLPRQQRVILEACRLLGIQAELSGRNDLLAQGRKFSGNSFYNHGGRSFHNGTLLIDADMTKMGRYLSPSPAKIASKGVASVASRVVNLRELCPGLTVAGMTDAMNRAFQQVYGLTAQPLEEKDFDQEALEKLYRQFSSRDWVYGATFPFDFSCTEKFPWGEVSIRLRVEQGICRQAAVYTDAMEAGGLRLLRRGVVRRGGVCGPACGRSRGSLRPDPQPKPITNNGGWTNVRLSAHCHRRGARGLHRRPAGGQARPAHRRGGAPGGGRHLPEPGLHPHQDSAPRLPGVPGRRGRSSCRGPRRRHHL